MKTFMPFLLLAISNATLQAGEPAIETASAAQPKGNSGNATALSAVHVGNSHSHPLRLLVPMAERIGHSGYKEGHVNILGASLGWNWNHGDQNKWPQTLAPDQKWDALTLLSWSGDDDAYAPKFAGEAFQGNPKCQCQWSLAGASLPAGIALSPDGVLSGRCDVAGKHSIVVKLTSGSESVERPLTLEVSPDTPPSIPEQTLPGVSLDIYVAWPLKVTGGVGTATWNVLAGELPYGVMLSPAGLLVGTPGEQGEFTFTIAVADNHPAGPRTAERQFRWKIGPAKPETLPVKFVITQGYDLSQITLPRDEDRKPLALDSVLRIDGKLTEPFWKLDQPLEKKVQGTPTKTAALAAVWTANCSGNTIPGRPIPYGSSRSRSGTAMPTTPRTPAASARSS